MNIFKILSSGDGSIKEPNMSAFLGYLLNPKEDHGLGSTLLEKVLRQFIETNSEHSPLKPIFSNSGSNESTDENHILDLSIQSRFNVDVVLEKALSRAKDETNQNQLNTNDQKSIVDIIIKITEHEKKSGEDLSFLFNEAKPVAFILLENKIRNAKKVTEQIKDQYEASTGTLAKLLGKEKWEIWRNKICTVLVSVNEDKKSDTKPFSEEFKDFQQTNPNSIHILWKDESENSDNIKNYLEELLEESNKGIISPIPSYTSDTIRALIKFIDDDFSSDVDDIQKGGKTKEFNRYDTLDSLLVAKAGTPFCNFIINNRIGIQQLLDTYSENTKIIYWQTMIAFKYKDGGKKNHFRLNFKSGNFEIILYLHKKDGGTDFITSSILGKNCKIEANPNHIIITTGEKFSIDNLLSNKVKDVLMEVIKRNNGNNTSN